MSSTHVISQQVDHTPIFTNAVKRTLQDKLSDIINVKDFGAVGDGVTDDTAAYNAAIASLTAGQTLIFPAGTYNINSGMVAADITALGVSLIGYGANVQVTGVTAAVILKFTNCGGTVRGLRFYGIVPTSGLGMLNAAYQGCQPILFNVTNENAAIVNGITVENCEFDNFGCQYWVKITNNSTFGIKNVSISHNVFTSRTGNAVAPTSLSPDSAFVTCQGLLTGTSGTISNITIANNRMDASYIRAGVVLYVNTSEAAITGNVITYGTAGTPVSSNCGVYGINLYRNAGSGAAPTKITVSGNVIISAYSCGIYCVASVNTVISGNHISGQTDTAMGTLPKGAIALNGVRNFTVSGNQLLDNFIGVMATGGSSYVDVLANKILSSVSSAQAVNISGNVTYINVFSNHITATGATSNGVFIRGISAGELSEINVSYNQISATFYCVQYYTSDATQPISMIFKNNRIKASIAGMYLVGITNPLTITGNVFAGNSTFPQIDATSSTKVSITDNVFEDCTSAYAMKLQGTQGTLWNNNFVRGNALITGTGETLGVTMPPTWTGVTGGRVQIVHSGVIGTGGYATVNQQYILLGYHWIGAWKEMRVLTGT